MSDRARPIALCLIGVLSTACAVDHLSYGELERDLDAIARVEGSGDEMRIHYEREVEQSPWYSRWLIVRPFKPVLIALAGDATHVELDNPSGRVRDLAQALAPACGSDLERASATAQRLVRIAELDPSALNRVIALNGLWQLAREQELEVWQGIERGDLTPEEQTRLSTALGVVRSLRPAVRSPSGAPLAEADAAKYLEALAGLTAQPVPPWTGRVVLIADLATILQEERDRALVPATEAALRSALRHAIQWTFRRALQDATRPDVRIRAIEILHEAGGIDGVPMLLALLLRAQETQLGADKAWEFDLMTQLRLVHLCGQLDRDRALRRVKLPGKQTLDGVAPIEFLARLALDDDFLSPLQLPALEAMALCLRRPRLELDGEGKDSGAAWVRAWYDEYRRSSS